MTTRNKLRHNRGNAVQVGIHNGDNHFHARPVGRTVLLMAGPVAVAAVAALVVVLVNTHRAAPSTAFTRVLEFTPPPAADPDPCRENQLCAYRGAVSRSAQFDLPVTDHLIDICMTVRADDPGFETLVAGSTRHIDLYPGRRCTGTPQVAMQVPGTSMPFHFFAYVVRS